MSDLLKRMLPRSKRLRLALGGVLVLIVGLAIGGYFYEKHRTGNIYHPHARFVPEASPEPPKRPVDDFQWPFYGYTQNHTRYFPAPASLHAPFRRLWVNDAHTLLEFPPVISGGRIFQLGDDAVLRVFNKHTGHVIWARNLGSLSASSPAVVDGVVYACVLSRSAGEEGGRVFALKAGNGNTIWSRNLSSRCESSPMVDEGKIFFGSQNGTVYALDTGNGSVVWTYHAEGAVKASPTLSRRILYFGDYSGHIQAVAERTGRRIWRSGSEGALLGSGTFYSTPAVSFGRVFLGNTDGRVYAYDAANGNLDWAVQTGAYVYASPAVTNAPGLGPTIYLGSYDGTFYAIDARSGHIAWTFDAHGKISGSATIIGRTVYFADLGTHRTYGLGISTGRPSFTMNTGSFDPAVSDGKNLYLTGLEGLYALAPQSTAPAATPAATTTAGTTPRPSQKPAKAKSGR